MLVARGELSSRGQGKWGSLDRDEVLAVGVARREAADRVRREREARASRRERAGQPPDAEHVWLGTREAAALMGVTESAISKRALKGRLPFVARGPALVSAGSP